MVAPVVDTTTRVVLDDAVPWASSGSGIDFKVLRVGAATATYTILTRFVPGITLPRHRHFGEVHAFTLQGRWRYLEYDWVSEAGAYVYEPPGAVHTLTVPADNDGPTVVLFTIDKGMVNLGPGDELLNVEDATTVATGYERILAAQGVAWPEAVLP